MDPFITAEEVRAQIRGDEVDTSDDEAEFFALTATRIILNHLKSSSPYEPDVDTSGVIVLDSAGEIVYTTTIRPEVRAAARYLVAVMWKNRDGDVEANFAEARLPAPVRALLGPLRDPALA
jgi:hypothetical protein